MNPKDMAKPKRVSARVQRILKKKEPQLLEGTKKCIVLKGHKTSQTITDVLQDVSKLLKPDCVNFSRKNDVLPFEDVNSIEFFCQKNDCATFIIGSHTKKRPNNLVVVSTFIHSILYYNQS
jgi:ribosome production factor 2